MHINYLNDRIELGFKCEKDLEAAQQVSNFIAKVKNKKFLVIICSKLSKKVLIVFLICRLNGQVNVSHPDFEVSPCSITKNYKNNYDYNEHYFDNFANSQTLDLTLKLKGGENNVDSLKEIERELDRKLREIEKEDRKMERLIQIAIAKSPQGTFYERLTHLSVGKAFQTVYEVFEPVFTKVVKPIITNERFLRVLAKFLAENEQPIKINSHLSVRSTISAKDILSPAKSRSSGIFAEALVNPQYSYRGKNRLTMVKNSPKEIFSDGIFSDGLTPSGLSINHDTFPENIRRTEILTQLRRAEPKIFSEILGENYQYSLKQLERKSIRHLFNDYNISIEGKTRLERALTYYNCVENVLKQENLIVRYDGMLSKRETTVNFGDPITKRIIVFEKNPLYKKFHFVTSYKISEDLFEIFEKTGSIGLSPEERQTQTNAIQKEQARKQREQQNERSLFNSLPKDSRIGNKELNDAQMWIEQEKIDPNFKMSEKQKIVVERAERYHKHKEMFEKNNTKFEKNNTKLFDDELFDDEF